MLGAAGQTFRAAEYDQKRRELSAKGVRRSVFGAEPPAAELHERDSFE